MCGHHRLDTVSDDFTAGQAVLHTDVPHGNPVVDTDRVEHKGHASRFADGRAHDLAKFLKMNVSGDDVDVGIGNGNERLTHIGIGDTGRLEQ